jgi:hypothetical protein
MERRAAVKAAEALAAAADALLASLRGEESMGSSVGDPLRGLADDFLAGLAETTRIDAMTSALRVHLAAGYSHAVEGLAPPAASPQEHTAQEMAVVAEVACAMTVREQAAADLLAEARELTKAMPLKLSALEAGSISWQHARIVVDEAGGAGAGGSGGVGGAFSGSGGFESGAGVSGG